MKNTNYAIDLFPLIILAIEKNVINPEKCWFKLSPLGKFISFSELYNLSEKDIRVFVYNFVIVNGLHNTIEYKRKGMEAHFFVQIEIPFNIGEQKEQNKGLQNNVLATESQQLLCA